MNKIERFCACALFFIPALWAPASALAQSPFDGTWRINTDQSKLSPKLLVFSVNKGMYKCPSCSPNRDVKADGQDQPVNGYPYDTMSVREVDPKSIATTIKKGGRTLSQDIWTVSDDGNTLTVKTTMYSEKIDQVVNSEATFTREGKAPAGANGTSGSWRIGQFKDSDNFLMQTFKSNGDEMSFSKPTGESYTAKLDGKDYPVTGALVYNSVSLKRVNDRTIEKTSKRDGKVFEVSTIAISPDGKKMTIVAKRSDGTVMFVAEKQ